VTASPWEYEAIAQWDKRRRGRGRPPKAATLDDVEEEEDEEEAIELVRKLVDRLGPAAVEEALRGS
jgi:hypothetical protein